MSQKNIQGQVEIQVRYAFKKVKSHSHDLSGSLAIKNNLYQFELNVPINSFKASDPDFDDHLREVTDSSHFPLAFGRGVIDPKMLSCELLTLPVKIEFHGVVREYMVTLQESGTKATFTLELESHNIKRPSLLGIKINNEVIIKFSMIWS